MVLVDVLVTVPALPETDTTTVWRAVVVVSGEAEPERVTVVGLVDVLVTVVGEAERVEVTTRVVGEAELVRVTVRVVGDAVLVFVVVLGEAAAVRVTVVVRVTVGMLMLVYCVVVTVRVYGVP